MIPKFRAYLKDDGKIVDVVEIDYRCNCIIWMNGKYTEIEDFEDIELFQSTGLKDKNGVEIYEGDVVKREKGLGIPHEIIFKDCEFKLVTSHSEESLGKSRKGGLIIVRNKHEHPHLLEE